MPEREKIKINITSAGMVTGFGYQNLRTPAQIELYEHQLAVLTQRGVQWEYVKPFDVSPITKRKSDSKKQDKSTD